MNKLEPLFDGTTIINLPFMIKLFKRYLKSSLAIALVITIFCGSLYFLQEDFYWTSISFSDAGDETSDASAAVNMMGERKGGIRATDILNLRSSVDFNRKVAQNLMSSEFYPKLRFDLNYLGARSVRASDIAKKCSAGENCILAEIVKALPKFYQISDKDRSGVNFSVEVKALDALTSNVLLKSISKAITDSRTDVVRYRLKEQEKSSTSILIEKKKEIDVNNFYELQDERDRLESELKEVQSKIDFQTDIITSVQNNLSNAESNYQRSKKISNTRVNYDELNTEMRRKELKENIIKLNSDIIALEDISSELSVKDKEIITQLKKEMGEAKKKLKALGEGGSQINLDQFVKQNDEKINIKELEYKVVKDQLAAAKVNYDELIARKKDILGRKIKAEQSIDILKPSIEFIKNLEVRIEQLKLKALSVNPDVRFDSYSGAPEAAKKMGLILILGYFVILQIIALLGYLLIRFYIDNKIYDEDDLKTISDNLKIIGNGPSY